MIKQYVKICIGLTLWLVLNAIFNLLSIKLSGFSDAVLFFVLCHLVWIGMIAAIPGVFLNRPKIFYWLIGLVYLLFLITYLIQVPTINLYLSNLGGLPDSLINYLYEYSSQLRSTMVMLAGNISVCLLVILISLSGVRIFADDNLIENENKRNRSYIVLWIVGLFMAFYLGWAALTRHNTFHSKAWDLAIFAQLIDNFRHGVFFEVNVRGVSNIFSDHFTPIIYIFSPLLYVWNDPSRLLLVVQAIFIVLGAIPVYLITKLKTGSQTAGVAFGIAYLLLPTLQFMDLFDFHPIVLAIPFFLAAWYAWELRRFSWMYFFTILSMLCQEEVWIIVGAMGLFLILFERERKHGLILTILGWGGFVAMVLWFFPMFRSGEGYFYFHRYAYLGNSFGEIVRNMAIHPLLWIPRLISPRAIMFIILMLIPVGFLPLWRPKYLLVLLPTYIYSALSIEDLQITMFAQYAAPYVPFIIIGAIYGAQTLGKTRASMELVGLAMVCAVLVSNVFFSPVWHGYAYQEEQLTRDYRSEKYIEALSTIPEEACVSTGSKFAPHLIRRNLYLFPNNNDSDWIILDLDDSHDEFTRKQTRNFLINQNRYGEIYVSAYFDESILVAKTGQYGFINYFPHIMYSYEYMDFKNEENLTSFSDLRGNGFPPFYMIAISRFPFSKFISGSNAETYYEYFLKLRNNQAKKKYYGVVVYVKEKESCDGLRFRKKPYFEVINPGDNVIEINEWANLHKRLNPPPGFFMDQAGNRALIFMALPLDENFQNTLEECFYEQYIKGRYCNRQVFSTPEIPENGFKATFVFSGKDYKANENFVIYY